MDLLNAAHDFTVIGGGPAGATTALCLARSGWSVALHLSNPPAQTPPGETLPPEINPVLRELGLFENFLGTEPLAAPGIVSAWGHGEALESDFIGNLHGTGWHVDRTRFDAMLVAEASAAGVELIRGNSWKPGGVAVGTIVDASGANGIRLAGSNGREVDDAMVAIVLRMELQGEGRLDLRTLIETTPGGWWYSSAVPGGTAVGMFFTSPEIYRDEGIVVGEQLAVAPLTNRRMAGAKLRGSQVVRASSSLRDRIVGENWVAVGDSASTYDPLSGRGIFKALRHARLAAAALDQHKRGRSGALEEYAESVRADFAHYRAQRHLHYAMEDRWPDAPFWRARRYPMPSAVVRPGPRVSA